MKSSKLIYGLWLLLAVIFVVLALKYLVLIGGPSELLDITYSKKNIIAPIFPSDYSTTGRQKEWEMRYFQPVLTGFEEKDGTRYLIAKYTVDSKTFKVKILVDGKLDLGYRVENVFLNNSEKSIKGLVSFDDLKNDLDVGKQIGIEYLYKAPASEGRDEAFCKAASRLCDLADFSISQKENLEKFLASKIPSDTLIIPAVTIYTTLRND